ncbi:MAG TPA: cytochrome c biogenesis protein CcsA [Phycisphaerales bacterium]|nr:cytochrome c biogenesis protein CcsA [Phycisphaerales bacterium]
MSIERVMNKTMRRVSAAVMMVVVAMTMMIVSPVARGQYDAPAGNEHPRAEGLSEAGKAAANPFGTPGRSSGVSNAEKAAFAAAVNLEPLRDLAVFHNGRVKVLDTLAGEMVQTITGRKDYNDFLHEKRSDALHDKITRVKYDPVFTFFDLIIDPAYYFDKPLIGINYLPLRRELVELQFPERDNAENKEVQERWMKLGRVTPLMLEEFGPRVAQTHQAEQPYMEGLGRAQYGMQLFIEAKANLEMVAPASTDQPWKHVGTLADDHVVRVAMAQMGEAWRARDAAKVNAAVATIAAELPKINSEVYPTTSRSIEISYNKLRAFEWGWVFYALSLVTLLLAFGTHRRWLAWTGGLLLTAGVAMHAIGFIARCLIAERFAIQNQFESMTGLSLFAVLVALGIMLWRKQWLFGAAAAAVGFMVLITATQTAIPGQTIEREAAILNTSVLLKYHVTTVLVSYGLIALGFVVSLFYLAAHYFAKEKSPQLAMAGGDGTASVVGAALGDDEPATTKAKLLSDLDKSQMIILQLAFWTLGVGILLGAWWADHSWGRWWAFDPKETWALITWIVYLIVIHVRMARPRGKGLTTAWLSVIGFFVMLWTYFGVNLLLPGLHAYA